MNRLNCAIIDGRFGLAIRSEEIPLPWPCHPGTTEGIAPIDGHLLMGLVEACRPEVIYEVGTNRGFSASLMASRLKSGGVWTVDINPALRPDFHGLDRVHPALGDVEKLPKGQFDLAFVDGDHTYEGCRRDLAVLLPLAKPESIFVLHDWNHDGVVKAREEILKGWCGHHTESHGVNQSIVYHLK